MNGPRRLTSDAARPVTTTGFKQPLERVVAELRFLYFRRVNGAKGKVEEMWRVDDTAACVRALVGE